MHVPSRLVTVAVTTLALLVVLLALRIAAAFDNDYSHVEEARMAVAKELIGATKGRSGTLYLELGDVNLIDEDFLELSAANPQLELRPMSERPPIDDACVRRQFAPNSCRVDDFLYVRFQTMILWRTALVAWSTPGCSGNYVAVKAFGRWRLMEEPWSVVCT